MSMFLALVVGLFTAGSAYEVTSAPSVHLEGSNNWGEVYQKDRVVTAWNPRDGNSHMVGGFEFRGGKLRVPENGRYYVYAQLYFNGRPGDHNPNRVFVKTADRNLLMIHNDLGNGKEATAFTGGVFELKKNDEIYVQVVGFDTKMWLGPLHSFFGAYMQY